MLNKAFQIAMQHYYNKQMQVPYWIVTTDNNEKRRQPLVEVWTLRIQVLLIVAAQKNSSLLFCFVQRNKGDKTKLFDTF